MAVGGDQVLFGNNEDYSDPCGKIRHVPAAKGKYGIVYFSHSNLFPQGGMNDQGLCFDYAATAPLPVTGSSQKPKYQGNLMDKVMAECATVKEALAMHDRCNLSFMAKHQTLALAYYQTGTTAKALETQRKAVALLPPGDSTARVALEWRLAVFEKASRKR